MSNKSTLMTPDPYHTPGYCGYVPQFKYQIGATFGSHTHSLLTSQDPEVASSANPLLAETYPPTRNLQSSDLMVPALHQNTRSWGDKKYVPQMVPGYTGYIPKRLHNFGCRYAESCHHAFSRFEQDQQRHSALMQELRTARTTSSSGSVPTPLIPFQNKAKPYLPSYAKQHSISPYYMPDDHPQKYYMSGYTGFVPKARKYLGQGYPIITRSALQEHAAEEKRLASTWDEPIQVFQSEKPAKLSTGLYNSATGLVPHYTGHIPGEKFQYGTTFGTSTRNSVPEISV